MRVIVIGVIILLVLYLLFTYLFIDRKIIKSSILKSDASEKNKIVKANEIPYKEGTTDFTISFWLYIDKYRSTTMGSKYPILEKISNNNKLFEISLNDSKNDINFSLNTKSGNGVVQRLSLENVYLQKWINVIMTAETRNLDIYLNGKLEETLILDSLPNGDINSEKTSFIFFQGLDSNSNSQMRVSNVQYLTRSITPREGWSIYKEGYRNLGVIGFLTSILSGYKVTFLFKKNGDKITEFDIGN